MAKSTAELFQYAKPEPVRAQYVHSNMRVMFVLYHADTWELGSFVLGYCIIPQQNYICHTWQTYFTDIHVLNQNWIELSYINNNIWIRLQITCTPKLQYWLNQSVPNTSRICKYIPHNYIVLLIILTLIIHQLLLKEASLGMMIHNHLRLNPVNRLWR